MSLITETYYLSLTQDNRGILRLRCSQDDTLRTVNLKLYNNGSVFVIPSGISASVSGVRQNGAVFSKSCTISQDRESVVLQLSSDITSVDGIIIAEIVLNDGEGGRLGTSNFIIQIEKNPIRAGVVQDTETPIEYINDFIEKIQTLTARLNNLITPSGDPSLAEVVDARIGVLDSTTYQTLGARLNAEFQRLNNALNGITILESTGDTTDRTSEILSKLNVYGTCKLGKGDFYVKNLVMPEDSMLVGSGNSTRIVLLGSETNTYIVKPRSGCIIEDISFYGGFTGTYSELIANSDARRHCIILDKFNDVNSENVILSNITINNFVGSAIVQRYTTGCHCKDVVINMCYAGIDISNASYDGQCTNVYISNTKFGVVQNGSNFVFSGCISKDSVQHIMSDQQNTECTFSSCTFFDSSLETTAKLANLSNARSGFVFDNCMFDSSLSMTLNACDGIVIKGTNFVGSDTFVITVSNGRNTLLLITDCIADVEPVVTNAGTAARITSCYLKDGTAWSISEADITVDEELSDESENPIQNKAVASAISEINESLGDQTGIISKNVGYYINLTIDPVDISNPSSSSTGLAYALVDCSEGDKFVINAVGATNGRAWGFLDSSNHVLSMADANATVTDLELTVPTNAVKLIINDKSGGMSYKVGNNLASKVGSLEKIEAGIPDDVKAALLACLDKVLWKDGTSPSSYNALENALYPNSYPKITASFNSGANTIYTDNTLSTLKQYLTVKYYESSESAGVTVSSENYALTGALVAGTSVVYVSYNNLVCSFTIYNVVDFYNTWKWETTQLGQITAYQGTADPNQADTTKYPSRVFYNANNAMRRTVGTSRGKRSYNVYNQTGVNSNVYPIPVPANATKYSIKVAPTSTPYYVFCHVCEYANGAYGDSITNYRTTWTRCSEESPVEKDITGHPANAFMIVNIKYDSAGTTNPPVPDNVTIEFSED